MDVNIGISKKDRAAISDGLSRVLADSYTLYLKTHNYHWNVTGPMLQTLHLLFETQYTELALAVDLIAERIRALGRPAPGTYAEFARLSSIKEKPGVPKAADMIRDLVAGQEAVVRTARAVFPLVEKSSDEPSADLLTQRMQVHEKSAWMLRSLLEKQERMANALAFGSLAAEIALRRDNPHGPRQVARKTPSSDAGVKSGSIFGNIGREAPMRLTSSSDRTER